MAFSKITTRGMSGDTLEAGDIAANAIGASELADNAVDTAAIADNAVTNAKIPDDLIQVKPHIKPGTLYPSWSGLLADHSPSVFSFTDSSASAHALVKSDAYAGNQLTHHSAIQKKVGNSAIRFNGSTDAVIAPAHADWNFGAGSGTIEFWFHPVREGRQRLVVSQGGSNYFILTFGTSARKISINTQLDTSGHDDHTSTDLALNEWHHVALVKDGTSSLKIYTNGTLTLTSTDHDGTWADSGEKLYIGRYYLGNSEAFEGWMDEIRIVKGTAVYSGNFTPPTALTATGGTYASGTNVNTSITSGHTKLLIHSNEATTNFHSGAYGTAQSDGRKYYYTDIRGSKPIKDPRIGGHFGSQRHKFKSLQLLEQETATHGENVYSIDGREWMRSITGLMDNGSHGLGMYWESSTVAGVIEIVGYFSDANLIAQTRSGTARSFTWAIDGGSPTTDNSLECTVDNPLRGRYVDASSVVNLGCGATLGVHTLKLSTPAVSGDTPDLNGIELIAQDTSSTANKSKIQIPSQNVVSYGKKFTVSGTPHYDPFNGFTSGTDISGYIDEATSLGMSNWKVSSTWYRPFNGGRVVKWVDSSGNIKTSVTMMPPNAQNINGTASNAIDLSSSQTNDDPINFNTSAIDHSLSEVAKTWFAREFGNGNANAGSGGSWKDMTMLYGSTQDPAYVMDDGLTSIAGNDLEYWGTPSTTLAMEATSGDYLHTTFIGTGVSVISDSQSVRGTIALNLPYGTHILKQVRTGNNHPDLTLNGVSITKSGFDTKGSFSEITFHQPKKPPVPDDACILADYMLMADFVPIASAGIQNISKGVRSISCSRDMFWDETDDATVTLNISVGASASGFDMTWSNAADSAGTETVKLPTFSTNTVMRGYGGTDRFTLIGPATEAGAGSSADATGQYIKYTNNYTLGTNVVGASVKASKWLSVFNMEVVTPIHTSSHYQTFETPYLKELVGGDRNMEQHNLIVTPDGKSWDEVTRDTSYIGNCVVSTTNTSTHVTHANTVCIMEEWRGGVYGKHYYFNKDFAIAYDRIICLVDGQYELHARTISRAADGHAKFVINGTNTMSAHAQSESHDTPHNFLKLSLVRGDYIQVYGHWYASDYWAHFNITRL